MNELDKAIFEIFTGSGGTIAPISSHTSALPSHYTSFSKSVLTSSSGERKRRRKGISKDR
ncbi:hypothetical protein [Thermococcus siculi]|uniref:hypothetical protein n=1 Tax=Thermococcus siculi TaxID=72803 RepID=UPI0012FD4AA1|nr:hypothetical protein [Thermococcus siculi]